MVKNSFCWLESEDAEGGWSLQSPTQPLTDTLTPKCHPYKSLIFLPYSLPYTFLLFISSVNTDNSTFPVRRFTFLIFPLCAVWTWVVICIVVLKTFRAITEYYYMDRASPLTLRLAPQEFPLTIEPIEILKLKNSRYCRKRGFLANVVPFQGALPSRERLSVKCRVLLPWEMSVSISRRLNLIKQSFKSRWESEVVQAEHWW